MGGDGGRDGMWRVARFGVVGVACMVLDWAVTATLVGVGVPVWLGVAVGFCVSSLVNHRVSASFVFRADSGGAVGALAFVLLSLVGLGIAESVAAVVTGVLGTGARALAVAKAISSAAGAVWNYISRSRLLFRNW